MTLQQLPSDDIGASRRRCPLCQAVPLRHLPRPSAHARPLDCFRCDECFHLFTLPAQRPQARLTPVAPGTN